MGDNCGASLSLGDISEGSPAMPRRALTVHRMWVVFPHMFMDFRRSNAVKQWVSGCCFMINPNLCINWFKVRENCTSVSRTSSQGMALTQQHDMDHDDWRSMSWGGDGWESIWKPYLHISHWDQSLPIQNLKPKSLWSAIFCNQTYLKVWCNKSCHCFQI